jgi:ankyrin repeat protein
LGPTHIDVADYAGFTPLQKASLHGFAHIVKHLIRERCPVDRKAPDGYAPLMNAVENGHLEVVETLPRKGHVDPTCRNNKGKHAIDLVDIEDENAKEIVSNLVKAMEVYDLLPPIISGALGSPTPSRMDMRIDDDDWDCGLDFDTM